MAGRTGFADLTRAEWEIRKKEQLAHLAEVRAGNPRGIVPEYELDAAAAELDRTPGQVRRMLNKYDSPPPRQPLWVFAEWLIPLYYAHGWLKSLHEELLATRDELAAAGAQVPSELTEIPNNYVTFWRAFDRMPKRVKEFGRRGAPGLRRRFVYLMWQASERNEIWQADCCKLDIWILPKGRKKPVRPWLIVFLDDCTRMVMGAMLCLQQPTAEEVGAACVRAMRRKPTPIPGVWFGGRPGRILWDNGPEFIADLITLLASRLGFIGHAVARHTPTKKGKVERYFGAFRHANLRKLPAYTGSPLSWTKRNIFRSWAHRPPDVDPDRKRVYHGPLSDLLTQEDFIVHMANCIRKHNFIQRPRDLGGMTRWEGWCSDQTPLVEVPLATVRDHLRALPDHTVSKQGIELYGRYYAPTNAEGHGYANVDQVVSVRTLPNSVPWLEVFDTNGRWLDTFKPSKEFSAEEIAEREAVRLATYHKAKQHAKRAGALRVTRIGGLDALGAMPSLADVAVSASAQPAVVVQAPRIVGSAPAAGQLFTQPVDVEAAVVAARKKAKQSSGRARAARAKGPSLVLLPLEDSA